MNSRLFLFVAFVLLGARFTSAQPAASVHVEFAGYIKTAAELKFVLMDPAAKLTSDWLAVGGSFSGYKITGYDARTETLAVEKDGATTRLRLKGAGTIAPPWWETWPPDDVSQLTEVQKLILHFEVSIRGRFSGEGSAIWREVYFTELNMARARKPIAREDAAVVPSAPQRLQTKSEYAEVLRHMLGWLQEKKRTLAPDFRNREQTLGSLDRFIAETEKELAN